jgi:hypothetical protein
MLSVDVTAYEPAIFLSGAPRTPEECMMADIKVGNEGHLFKAHSSTGIAWLRGQLRSQRCRRLSKRATKSVTGEAVAVLNGRAWRFRDSPHVGDSPHVALAWVHLNQLAHADFRTLRRVANQVVLCEDWTGVTATLAAEMLDLAGGKEGQLLRLQRECLIPLELDLLACGHSATRWGPGLLLRSCRTRLEAHPFALGPF